jgi:hypothetical protein
LAAAESARDLVILRFGQRRIPRSLADLAVRDITGGSDIETVDAVARTARRVIVVGAEADLAAVLTRLLRIERLDVEVAHLTGRGARRVRSIPAQRVPLIRDETGQVIVSAACWLPPRNATTIHGEGVVDDTVLFDGDVRGVRIEPTTSMPGLRARVQTGRLGGGRWVSGRAAQLGTPAARVLRDGVEAPREVRRSTFYRHTEGWLRVR